MTPLKVTSCGGVAAIKAKRLHGDSSGVSSSFLPTTVQHHLSRMSSTANVRSTTLQYGASVACPTGTSPRIFRSPCLPPPHVPSPHTYDSEQLASNRNWTSVAGWPLHPMRGSLHPNQRQNREKNSQPDHSIEKNSQPEHSIGLATWAFEFELDLKSRRNHAPPPPPPPRV